MIVKPSSKRDKGDLRPSADELLLQHTERKLKSNEMFLRLLKATSVGSDAKCPPKGYEHAEAIHKTTKAPKYTITIKGRLKVLSTESKRKLLIALMKKLNEKAIVKFEKDILINTSRKTDISKLRVELSKLIKIPKKSIHQTSLDNGDGTLII